MSWSLEFTVRWQDLDVNWHLRNTAYADFGTHTRIAYLAEHGFGPERILAERMGPVIFREETRYLKEVRFGGRLSYDFRVAGLSDDASHFELEHRATRDDGETAAVLRVEGAWMDLDLRKLRRPPADLKAIFEAIERTEDFRGIKSVVRD